MYNDSNGSEHEGFVSTSSGTLFNSVEDQKPKPYFKINDEFPEYVQVNRNQATINGSSINFKVNAFDPNMFLRSKAYLKVSATIQKQEFELNGAGEEVKRDPSNYVKNDRIYKKPGLVLQNACTQARLRLNSHTMVYDDLRYITKKLNMSFAGKKINNTYFTTSGATYENYDGVYNEYGEINAIKENSADFDEITVADFGFDLVAPNRVQFTQASNRLTFTAGGGDPIDLFGTQIFIAGDEIVLASGEAYKVIGTLTIDTLLVTKILGLAGDMPLQNLVVTDIINRHNQAGFNGDDGRQQAYDDAARDISNGSVNSSFQFTEPLTFGIFNHLSDYKSGEIATNAWNNKMSPLIPYIRELELSMNFKDIASNSLIYSYGKLNIEPSSGNTRQTELIDISIDSAELVLFWVKPRSEIIRDLPQRVKIQSWQYQHRQFPLVNIHNPEIPTLSPATAALSSQNNLTSHQVPSYILYYGMVNKDVPTSYKCRAVNSDFTGTGRFQKTSLDTNSVETGMHTFRSGNFDLNIRSNTLGGDDIIDVNYNNKEMYRILLKNSVADFPYSETKFRGLATAESLLANYPSEYYILLGEEDLNSFFVRKGQLQRDVVLSFQSNLLPTDGYSISNKILVDSPPPTTYDAGTKEYALHIFYIYDRYYVELSSDGLTDSKFDSSFY